MSCEIIEYDDSEDQKFIDDLLQDLFCKLTDEPVLRQRIEEFYEDMTQVPTFEDVEQYFLEYNDSISFQITEIEIRQACHNCERRNTCWQGGIPFDPAGWDWPQVEEFNDCFEAQRECNDEYLGYNWGAWSLGNIIISTILQLGYSVIIERGSLSELFEDPPLVFFEQRTLIFNDAQTLMLPEMKSAWKPKPLFFDHPLLLA